MNPNNQPQPPTPPISPTPPTPPVSPAQPPSVTQQTNFSATVGNQSQTETPQNLVTNPSQLNNSSIQQPKKSHKGLIIGIIVGVFALFVLPFILLTIYLAVSRLQVAGISNGFMKAMTQGNIDEALTYTDGSAETKQFLNGMATGVKASSFTSKGSADSQGKKYFLYSLQGSTNNSARTALEKGDKGWKVVEFVAGNNMSVIPGTAQAENPSTAPTSTASSSNTQCLVQSDFDNWYKGMYGKTATEEGFNFHKTDNMFTTNVHFPPDSVEYSQFDNTGQVEVVAKLAKDPAVAGKQFTILLSGGVGTSQADKDFAKKRAEKVKSDLVSLGVPANKIVIEETRSASDYESNPGEIDKRMSRVVVMGFDPTCTSSSGNGR